MMRWDKDEVYKVLFNQLHSLYWLTDKDKEKIDICMYNDVSADCESVGVIARLEKCFTSIRNKYYYDGEETFFSPLHVCQYTFFLYFLANTLFRRCGIIGGGVDLCNRIYGISKIVSAMDLYYEVDMPDIFMFDHPTGSVIGRAAYSDYFCFSQGCTVGNNKGIYPKIGKRVLMNSDSKILGKCNIGNNVIIAANTYVKDEDIPDNSIVFGSSPNLTIKTGRQKEIDDIMHRSFRNKG